MEREKRKKNLMFFGLPEAKQDIKGKDRAAFDMSSLRALKTVDKELEIKNADVEFSFRVGKYDAKKTRPLCVKFEDFKVTRRILGGGKLLKQAKGTMKSMNSVYIGPDFTQTQREERRKLYEELKKKREVTNDDDWIIKSGKIIKKLPDSQPVQQRRGVKTTVEKDVTSRKKHSSEAQKTRTRRNTTKKRRNKDEEYDSSEN